MVLKLLCLDLRVFREALELRKMVRNHIYIHIEYMHPGHHQVMCTSWPGRATGPHDHFS